jgi:hypothetical protein
LPERPPDRGQHLFGRRTEGTGEVSASGMGEGKGQGRGAERGLVRACHPPCCPHSLPPAPLPLHLARCSLFSGGRGGSGAWGERVCCSCGGAVVQCRVAGKGGRARPVRLSTPGVSCPPRGHSPSSWVWAFSRPNHALRGAFPKYVLCCKKQALGGLPVSLPRLWLRVGRNKGRQRRLGRRQAV